MAYSQFRNGFVVQTSAAIDRRMFLTKVEMRLAEENYNLPSTYLCVCPDDGRIYLYKSTNTVDLTTGKYRALEAVLDFSDPVFQTNFETALQNSQTLLALIGRVEDLETVVGDSNSGLVHDVTALQSDLATIKVDGGEVVVHE